MSKVSKIVTILTAIAGLIGVILYGRLISAGDDAIVAEYATKGTSVADAYISYGQILLIITAVIAILYSLWSLLKNPAALKKAIIALVALGILLAISYALANDGATVDRLGNIIKDGQAGSISKWVSTLMNFSGVLFLVGLATVLWGGLKSVTSK